MFNLIYRMSLWGKENRSGFTLVETLVVVVILVSLAAVATPIFLNQRTKANEAAAQNELATVASVVRTGQSVGETVFNNGDEVGYESENVGDQKITLGEVYQAIPSNNEPILPTTEWCFAVTTPGGGQFQMANTDSKPELVETGDPCGVAPLGGGGGGGGPVLDPNLGVTWATLNASPTISKAWYDVTYGNGIFVVVGNDGSLATSADGINWSNEGFVDDSNSGIYGLAFGGGKFVAVIPFASPGER